jgi:hypothetical protein
MYAKCFVIGMATAISNLRERRRGFELMPRKPCGYVAVSNDDRVAAVARTINRGRSPCVRPRFFMRWTVGAIEKLYSVRS